MTDSKVLLQFIRSHSPRKKWTADQVHDALARTTWAPVTTIEKTREAMSDLANEGFLTILPDGRYQISKTVGHPWRRNQA